MASQDGPAKVFLWAVPRSMSTSFLKCMTFVPDTVAWFEPYSQLTKFSHKIGENQLTHIFQEFIEKCGGASAVTKIESGYDASDKDFDWLKQQLEADYQGKKLVFVKDIGVSIFREFDKCSDNRLDKIPNGFRHTFIIRNPKKYMMSLFKNLMKKQDRDFIIKKTSQNQDARYMQYLNDMYKYVKSQGLETNPIIIDADDLIENPKAVLEAYCKEVGIPFTEELLTWEAGDDVMTKHWMVSKQTILTFRTIGVHEATFASTGFTKPAVSQSADSNEQLLKLIPPAAMEKLKTIMTREMAHYQEMYSRRLIVS